MAGPAPSIVALAGGVGAARFLRGLVHVVAPESVTAVVNTGDDHRFYGVHVSPDLDIVTYTLAGIVNRERGFGIAEDRFEVIGALERFGHETWFRLGDRDFATCLHRTLRLADGWGLAAATDEIRRRFGVASRILPMAESPCPTYVTLSDGRRAHFEEYLVRDGAPADVADVDLSAAAGAEPAPGVTEALRAASVVLVCPSNPVVSIGPILAVPAIGEALARCTAPIVAVSPIVGGRPIKGPADRLLRATGSEVSARGVARRYASWVRGFVLDRRDADQLADCRALGLEADAVDTIMRDAASAARLAEATLDLARRLG